MRQELLKAFDFTRIDDSVAYSIRPGARPGDTVTALIFNPCGIQDAFMTIQGRDMTLREALEGTRAPVVTLPDGTSIVVLRRAVFEASRSETFGCWQETWTPEFGLAAREKREVKRRGRPPGSYTYGDIQRDIVAAMFDLYRTEKPVTLDNVAEHVLGTSAAARRNLERLIASRHREGKCLKWKDILAAFTQTVQGHTAFSAKRASTS